MLTTPLLSFLVPRSAAAILDLAFVWPQPLAPAHSLGISALVATLPLAVVLIFMGGLRQSGALSAALGLATAFLLAIFVWGMPLPLAVLSGLYGFAYAVWPILWIVFAALWLYNLSVDIGKFDLLRRWMSEHASGDPCVQAILVAFCFGALLEGTSGFGSPVAVAGFLLLGLGFTARQAVTLALIANTTPVAFGALGIPIVSIHDTISEAFGSAYVNNFVQAGRVKRVFMQADAPYRMLPKDIDKLYVRNNTGKMVPFSAFTASRWTSGSPRLERFNGFPSMNIWGEPPPGRSSGEAMQAMEEMTARLPQGIGYEWNGLSYQERAASSQTFLLYAFSVIVIFLFLAALYESWSIPISILLVLPLGIFGAALATWSRGLHNDVYFQIGFLTTLGLTTKNAILIVQFARERMAHGEGLIEATLGAARVRLRPVVMTSLAFFFGTLPLAVATGAGAGAMKAIGTAVTGGMLTATLIAILYIPLFFVLVSRIFKGKQPGQLPESPIDTTTSSEGRRS